MRRWPVPFIEYDQQNSNRKLICTKDFKGGNETTLAFAIKNHDAGDVTAAVAIIRGAPNSDKILVKVVLVTFHDKLMGSRYQGEVIDVVELLLE